MRGTNHTRKSVDTELLRSLTLVSAGFPHRRKHAREIFDEFGVANYRDALISAVPQDARELIDIAMALVSNPRMLLLDEPTFGVSVEERFLLMDAVMAAMRHHGTTVLFVEHDIDIVARYVNHILASYSGEIMADGTPVKVLSDERGVATAG